MANIIEKEIDRRESLIVEKADKEALASELEKEAQALRADAEKIDAETLKAEVEELKTYLPQPEVSAEVVEAEEVNPIVKPFLY